MAYIAPPVVIDPEDLFQQFVDYLQENVPGWEPADGNLDVWLAEATAQIDAQVAETASEALTSIFRWYGQNLAGVPPVDATNAEGLTTWTLSDTAGHTIPAGTTIAVDTGELVAFQTVEDVVVAPGSSTAVDVTVVAVDAGAAGSDLTGDAVLVDSLDYVTAVAFTNTTTGGEDAEADDVYLGRLVEELRLLTPRPILPGDFATLAKRVAGVERATALDGYSPGVNERQSVAHNGTGGTATLTFSGQTTAAIAWNASAAALQAALEALSNIAPGDVIITGGPWPAAVTVEFTGTLGVADQPQITGSAASLTPGGSAFTISTTRAGAAPSTLNERMVSVAAVDSDGNAVGSTARTALDVLFNGDGGAIPALREATFEVHIIDPTYSAVNVTFTAIAWPGFDAAEVEAAAEAAVAEFLSPARWGEPDFGDERQWINETKVRYLEVSQILNEVEGLRYVSALTVNGGTADVTLSGPAPMPTPGTIAGTVTA